MNPQWLNIIYKLQLLVGNFNIPEKTLPPPSLSLWCKETPENHGMTPQEFLGILTISGSSTGRDENFTVEMGQDGL